MPIRYKSKAVFVLFIAILVVLLFPFNLIFGSNKLEGKSFTNEHLLRSGQNRTVIFAEGNYEVTLVYSMENDSKVSISINDTVIIKSDNQFEYHRITVNQFNAPRSYRSVDVTVNDNSKLCYFNKVNSSEYECEIDFENSSIMNNHFATAIGSVILIPLTILLSIFVFKKIEKE
jgi:hypothetical protein